ncbi:MULTISPECIES: peptidoglycan-associated lipoprotein Pal [Salinicola]|uniref:peptidoglycan-associated lipoprotein Pal n=1 Tax=Salinicola TaxID=404432 RepID=UPI000D0A2784|nr:MULTISPECIES: peptidoglycan-associated lipoprotein Pal [Salinicola]MCE3025640.1 peptidoglycan-associated lipoprotein Pal [Salinicola sp. DM10]WIX34644.1 peptidoglycan-associated lipoprotein Pal [Salinicola sp. JS01]
MQFKTYAKTLAVALSLAVVAGCSSSGGTQEGNMDGTSGNMSGQGMTSGQGANGSQMNANQQRPSVDTIYFAFDSDEIRPEFESVLRGHAQYLMANPSVNVTLEGYADERGTREYNLGLGERRAQSVEQYLTVQGVSPSQISIVSYGEERPAVQGHTEEAYAKNRRVVFDYK